MILYLLLIGLVSSSQILGQQSLAVTIYNDQFAMVKDVRTIKFDKGQSTLYFTDVSENIQTETVTFKALKNPNSIRVYEQNFEKNLIDQNSILKKYLEKKIDVVAELGDQVRRLSGTLLSQDSGFILQTDTGIISLNKVAAIDLPAIPDGFFTVPTLNWKVFSTEAQSNTCQVAYRTTGFNWAADYSIVLNNDETKGDIGGWVTIDNNSGKKYVNAKLKLIAGDVNVVKPQP